MYDSKTSMKPENIYNLKKYFLKIAVSIFR